MGHIDAVTPVRPALAALGLQLLDDLDSVVDRMASQIEQEVEAYGPDRVPAGQLRSSCRAHTAYILRSLGSFDVDVTAPQQAGRERAEQGVPLSEVMSAYRVGSRTLWEQIAQAGADAGLSAADLVAAASHAWQAQSLYVEAMSTAYRDVLTRKLIQREHERSALVGGLLEGRLPAGVTAWEALQLLGLPTRGPFVIVAVDVSGADYQPLVGAEARLRRVGFESAWRLLPDAHAALIHLPEAGRVRALASLLREHMPRRVGISPVYDALPAPGAGLRYARLALLAATEQERVTVFDESPYSVVAVGDPQLMSRYADLVLGDLARPDHPERPMLFETFLAWVDHGGSAAEAARELSCHPNTVRYRLRQLGNRTDRDVHLPRDLAELSLAVESSRRLEAASITA